MKQGYVPESYVARNGSYKNKKPWILLATLLGLVTIAIAFAIVASGKNADEAVRFDVSVPQFIEAFNTMGTEINPHTFEVIVSDQLIRNNDFYHYAFNNGASLTMKADESGQILFLHYFADVTKSVYALRDVFAVSLACVSSMEYIDGYVQYIDLLAKLDDGEVSPGKRKDDVFFYCDRSGNILSFTITPF